MQPLRLYRQFKKRHKIIHILIMATAVVMFWRGVWGILDTYLLPDNTLLSYAVSVLAAFTILYLDDFQLNELE
ncbi:hypothetical protein COU89_00065 [Candidatus Roizmanbacteria bacterium CG10_big_fil_rev_8_21_14_0_10_45_7]|uniref:Uncharacterized protein n=1 Tax=Candidatus Roizmanbacteria bacterium CG10_big_fil_rev_8_21_14_0_10_45_7 TaxID=1974854 RepID=A0A2M8KVQ4_9BACT|nr:MAG: hypothetical protein COU89_00065 [Candidatus Roizmanbacteria bacterium CG10_big_fil_rev_8_21_14_0_10_45_7]